MENRYYVVSSDTACVFKYLLCVSILNRALRYPRGRALARRRPVFSRWHGRARAHGSRATAGRGTFFEWDGDRATTPERQVNWKVSWRCAWESNQWSRNNSQISWRVLKSLLHPIHQCPIEILFSAICVCPSTDNKVSLPSQTDNNIFIL